MVTDTSFEEKIATVSIGTLEKENMILFFGTNFAQYDEYVTSVFNHSIIEKQDTEDKGNNVSERSSEEKYVHCGYATNKKVGSNTASGETVIMTAAKRDFNDRDAYTGFEIVRVFSRSNKARAAVSGASSAVPYKAIMTFECTTPDYLEIVNTYPSPSNISLPSFIGIYSTLNGGIAFAEIFTNEILNLISSVSRSFDSTNNTPENNYSEVTITIDSTNAYDTDLPSSESAASAKSNDENGVLCKFKYDSMGNDSISSGSVDVSGRIQYRIYIGSSHRISTLTTGYATLTHSIINR